MLTRHLAALGEKVCRRPVFPSRKRPNWHRFSRLFAPFAPGVDQLRVVLLETVQKLITNIPLSSPALNRCRLGK